MVHSKPSGPFGRMALAASVTSAERVSPGVALIRFTTDRPIPSWTPGDKVKLMAPGGSPRSYTPAHAAGHQLDILFALHDQGPTARWAAKATPGQEIWTTPPVPSVRAPSTGRVWVCGDATALGLAIAIASSPDVLLDGVFELPESDAAAPVALRLPVRITAPGGLAVHVPADGFDHYVVSGEATAARSVVQQLRTSGVPSSKVLLKPYWSQRGKLHRKWVTSTGGV